MRISISEAYKEYQKYFINVEQFVRFILDNRIKVYLSRESIINGLPVGKPYLSLGDRVQDKQSYMLKYFQTETDDLCLSKEQFFKLWSENTQSFIESMNEKDRTLGYLGELEVSLADLFMSPKEFVEPLVKNEKFEVEIEVPDSSYRTLLFKLGRGESYIETYSEFAAQILKIMIERYRSGDNQPCVHADVGVDGDRAHFRKTSAFGGKFIQHLIVQKDGLFLKPRVQFS